MKLWPVLCIGLPAVLGVVPACSDDPAEAGGAHDGGAGDSASDATDAEPPKIAGRTFGAFEPWARPIEDFLAVGEQVKGGNFNASITDLAPMGDRMFIGYGDADYNLGEHTPIEIRYFGSKDDPTAKAATIDAEGQGAPQTTPTQSGEEQIDRYRLLDGVLWQAGIDSIDADELHTQATTDPKAIEGNVYRREGDVWKKFRSLVGGEHVHDLASFKGAVYSVGSGADTRIEFEAGQIFRYLWRSTDQGASFDTVQRIQHPSPGQGDTRWVTLASTSDTLYLFGYESVFATNSTSLRNARFDGSAVEALPDSHGLAKVFANGSLALPDGAALVWGVDVSAQPVHYTALRVAADGSTVKLAALAGSTVIDAALTETGEVLYLALAGDTYGTAPASWALTLLVADAGSPDATSEVLKLTLDLEPVSIAYWQGALFLGDSYGGVMRATGSN